MGIENWKQFIGEPKEVAQRHETLEDGYIGSKYEGKKHIKAQELKPLVGEQKWESYFKFAFVRNPWDRTVSTYFHRRKVAPASIKMMWPSSTYVFRALLKMKYQVLGAVPTQQVDYLTDEDGNLMVDFVGRFENLNGDFKSACERIGVNASLGGRYDPTDHTHYSDYYDATCRRIITDAKSDDIDTFEFDFETP